MNAVATEYRSKSDYIRNHPINFTNYQFNFYLKITTSFEGGINFSYLRVIINNLALGFQKQIIDRVEKRINLNF